MTQQRWPQFAAAVVLLALWSVCLMHTAPGIEARLQQEAETALQLFPAASVQVDGRRAVLSGVAGGDYAFAARRLLGVRGLADVRPAS